jgi:hypothetical protein
MDINLQIGAILPQALPSARSADSPVVQNQQQAQTQPDLNAAASTTPNQTTNATATTPTNADSTATPAKSTAPNPADVAEEKRYEQLTKAAQNFFKDVYAVSDTDFTIYKDAQGQYITRYTSLRDGKVTYVPEQQMLQYAQANSQSRSSLVQIEA